MIFNQQISIIRAGQSTSVYSSEVVKDWARAKTIEVPYLVSVQPQTTTEDSVERPQIITRWRMYTPPGTDLDLLADDRILLGGELLMQLVGSVMRWPDPVSPGETHHVECVLEAVDG